MTSFEFSMYDYSDPLPLEQNNLEEEPKKEIKHDPFFDMYDPPDISENEPVIDEEEYQGAKPPWLVKAEKQPFKEKIQELPPFGRGIASSASLGYSEKIPGMELGKGTEQETKLERGGEFVGAALPISRAAKTADFIVSKAPKVLQPLRMLMHGGATGAIYETSKQAAGYTQGKEVDLWQVPKTAAEFAVFTQLLGIGANLAERFQKLPQKVQANVIEKGIIPDGIPKDQFKNAQEMLESINKNRPSGPGGPPPPPPPGAPPGPPPPPIVKRRITPGQDIGLRPSPSADTPDLRNQVGNIFSQNRFYNTTQGGQALKNEIMDLDQDVYRGVNDLYRTSRDLNSQIEEIHPRLVGQIEARVNELEAIPEPSDVQRRVIRASNNILDDLRVLDEEGNLSGYSPINNQTLIDQIQSLRQIIDYDFAHGDTKNIFRPLIDDLQDAAIAAADTAGMPEAAEALNDARSGYRTWVETFDNDYIRPFRDSSNQDFSKLFKSSLDLDESNMLRRVLNLSDRGQELANASTREIVEKNLSKFLENPRGTNQREFDTALRELEAVITPEQSNQIRSQFQEARRRPNINAKKPAKRELTPQEKLAEEYKDKLPEDILDLMNTRSGIKKLRQDWSHNQEQKDLFDVVSKQKMRSILRENNIEKDFTGDELYKVLNKEKNYNLFTEFLGEEATEELRQASKEIGKKQVKAETRNKRLKKAADKVAIFKTLELILNLL